MKTETNSVDPVWSNNIELLATTEECLPVIGSSQVSSILSTLDTEGTEGAANMNFIILPSNDFRDSTVGNNLQTNYVILKETSSPEPAVKAKKIKKTFKGKSQNFEDMLYFVCNLCPFLCTNDEKITEHVENAHKNKAIRKLPQLKCPACNNIFYHKMSLRSHLIHDHGVGNSDLSFIIQAVVYYSNKNSKKPNNQTNYQQINNKYISKEINEQVNEDRNAIEDSNSCDKDITITQSDIVIEDTKGLNIDFANESENVKNHGTTLYVLQHTNPVKNKCPIASCKVRLFDNNKLKYHLGSHCEEGFKCAECGEFFSFWKTLSTHLWRMHKVDMELHSCDKCDYKTVNLSELNNVHKLIHSNIRAFVCDICTKTFKNRKQLRNHKLTHKQKEEKLLYICDVCTKTFKQKRQLRVHIEVVHMKIKPFLCSYCGYKGSSRSSLRMHMRQHTGEKPFACDVCSYTSSDHNSLRRHKLRHSGKKPYKCPHCDYACIQTSTFKVHLKTKHPGMEKDLMFICHECQFRTVKKEFLQVHMVTVHKQKPELNLVIRN